jgi:osmotically-inducible protein OsmY
MLSEVGVTTGHRATAGLLLAGTLGAGLWAALSSAVALSAPGAEEMPREIVVTAARDADAALTAKLAMALHEDPYIFADHVTVTTENGVVHVGGIIHDLSDLFAILTQARRIAGKGRLVNEIVYDPTGDDHD